jgi:preprotein translocase subunit SecD
MLSLVLVFFASACSRTIQKDRSYSLDLTKPQFTIASRDLAVPPVLGTNSAPSGEHATIVIRVQLTPARADAFQKFTREHKHQQTQLIVGSKVVAEPTIIAEISGGHFEMAFSDFDEARAVRDLLRKK